MYQFCYIISTDECVFVWLMSNCINSMTASRSCTPLWWHDDRAIQVYWEYTKFWPIPVATLYVWGAEYSGWIRFQNDEQSTARTLHIGICTDASVSSQWYDTREQQKGKGITDNAYF